MTLSIKNGGYTFLIRLDLMLSMSLWKEFQLLQILDDLSTKHVIKLILYENDVMIKIINNQNLTLQTYHKSTYTGLLLNSKSFTSFSYNISLIKYLVDRSFRIWNNWNSFHNDIESIKSNVIKNAYRHS